LFFAPGAGGRKPRQLRRLAVCALLAATAAGLAQFNLLQPRRAQAEQSPTLSGEAAIQRLKTDGGYATLAAAMAAAGYQPAQNYRVGRPERNAYERSATALSVGIPRHNAIGDRSGLGLRALVYW